MRFIFHPRHDRSVVDVACEHISLTDAIARASQGGPFMLTDRGSDSGFESDSADFDTKSVINRLDKIETALRGIDLANKIIAGDVKTEEEVEPSPEVDTETGEVDSE